MIGFWIVLAIILILFGIFIFSQGGASLGPAIMTIGVVILLVLAMTPARARDLDGRYTASPPGCSLPLGRLQIHCFMPGATT